MPDNKTFSIQPIRQLILRYRKMQDVSIDPFARNSLLATHTNDLNPKTNATFHMKADKFLQQCLKWGFAADLILFDPPYSLRQVKECYDSVGVSLEHHETQNGYWAKEKALCDQLLKPGGIFICFGWNSIGMGIKKRYTLLEVLLVCHGRGHNDTIVTVERKDNWQLNVLSEAR